jgi:CspA family cold shock protein
MAQGVVKWFNATKGYGFVQPGDGGSDVFVHITAVQAAGRQALEEGEAITYELEPGRDGRVSAGNLSFG